MVLSSHVVAELERMANYLIVLSFGQVKVTGTVDDLVAAHAARPAEQPGRNRPRLHARVRKGSGGMTATTITTRPQVPPAGGPVPWTKLAWVTWRQHRPALIGAAVVPRPGELCTC